MALELIEEIKNKTYKKNLYATDIVMRSAHIKKNIEVEKKIKEFSSIDSIQSIEALKEKVKVFENIKEMYGKNCIGSESLLYGHIHALYDYAKTSLMKPIALPRMEHGVNFSESIFSEEDIKSYPNRIFQGAYKKKMIHAVNPLTPIFCIGPYIHYATNYFQEDQLSRMKEIYGKTLLVFPTHSYESSSMEYDMKSFVDNVMDIAEKQYETVLVSAYWLNLNSRIYAMFESRGAKIVSAGARFDPNFLRRLKTIISLADDVVGNDIGTHIGYCLYLQKPFKKLESRILKKDSYVISSGDMKHLNKNEKLFTETFSGESKFMRKQQDHLYEKFWGGQKQIKTPEQIKNLISLAQKQLYYSRGNISQYDESVIKLFKELRVAKSKEERVQFELLSDSLNLNDHKI